MDRRNKTRHNLRLLCLAEGGMAHSAPLEGVTENMSRDGILMRWLDSVPLPDIGAHLVVEIQLPLSSDRLPRVMRCSTTVVRITRPVVNEISVALHIDKVQFRRAAKVRKQDFESLPVASQKVN